VYVPSSPSNCKPVFPIMLPYGPTNQRYWILTYATNYVRSHFIVCILHLLKIFITFIRFSTTTFTTTTCILLCRNRFGVQTD
jgi:hypothetical protein